MATLVGHAQTIDEAVFSPAGDRVVTFGTTYGRDDGAWMWDTRSGEPLARLGGHTRGIGAVAFFPDGHRVITASDDHTLKLFPASLDNFMGQAIRMSRYRTGFEDVQGFLGLGASVASPSESRPAVPGK